MLQLTLPITVLAADLIAWKQLTANSKNVEILLNDVSGTRIIVRLLPEGILAN
jgi:hypothetical protein